MVLNSNSLNKMQKNRLKRNPKTPKLKFGDFGLLCKNEGRIELVQITQLKKKIKTFIKKKKSEVDIIREKIWYFGRPNFFIQKKSKNSRMGKGKGFVERKAIRVRRNFTLFEFTGISLIKIKKLLLFSNKILSVKFFLINKIYKTYPLWSKTNKYVVYHNKYLFQ